MMLTTDELMALPPGYLEALVYEELLEAAKEDMQRSDAIALYGHLHEGPPAPDS